jgi:hypothetical protein
MKDINLTDELTNEKLLSRWFESLKQLLPVRDSVTVEKSRNEFLRKAQIFSTGVSAAPKRRHIGWIFNFGKEPKRMTTLVTLVLVLSIMFGGAGATVVAAQDSTPDDVLYGVKLASENARLEFTTRTESRLQLALSFAARRVQEMAAMAANGEAIPNGLVQNWETQLNEALQLAARLGINEIDPWLAQVQNNLRLQEQLAAKVNSSDLQDPLLSRVQARIQECLQIVEEGRTDPLQFQLRAKNNFQASPEVVPPGDGDCDGCDPNGPVENNGEQNPWTDDVPVPGSGYGPGDGDCDGCIPNGPAEDNGEQNPWTDEPPVPGSGYGPGDGDGDCDDCNSKGGSEESGSNNPWDGDSGGTSNGSGEGSGDGSGSPQDSNGNTDSSGSDGKGGSKP